MDAIGWPLVEFRRLRQFSDVRCQAQCPNALVGLMNGTDFGVIPQLIVATSEALPWAILDVFRYAGERLPVLVLAISAFSFLMRQCSLSYSSFAGLWPAWGQFNTRI